MLYKPTSPSPYAQCVALSDTEGDKIQFSCSMIGGSGLETARLKISDGNTQYYFDAQTPAEGEAIPAINSTTKDFLIGIGFNTSKNTEYSYYTISNSSSLRNDGLSGLFSSVILPDKDYTWQTRLYEKDSFEDNYRSSIWMAYGVVGADSIGSLYTYSDSEVSNNTLLGVQNVRRAYGKTVDIPDNVSEYDFHCMAIEVRPHLNIFFKYSTIYNASGIPYEGTRHLCNYYDNNARYYIKINGKYLRILDYMFYCPLSGNYDNKFDSSDIDAYGYPKKAYVIIEYSDYFVDSEGNFTIKEGDQYEIYCNYIDSDEYYFNVVNKPTLTFTGTTGNDISSTTEEEPAHVGRSDFALNGTYNHTNGARIEKYNISLYKNTGADAENKVWEIIDQTEDVYSSAITYSYDMLMNGNTYKIVFNACDSLGYVITKEIYIACSYGFVVSSFTVEAKYYSKHDSVVVEWNIDNPEDNFDNIHHFEVYKTIGDKTQLHKVYSTANNKENIVEDFAVGNLCDYTYYVYPVAEISDGGIVRLLGDGVSSPVVNFNYGATTIFGLVQDEEDLNTYTIDYNEMWRFEFNLENTGTTLNMDKTFTDTQHRFPKMSGGFRKYNTTSVKGLIGYYDCEKDDYIENYDLLEDWENFCSNNKLKLLKDRRGRLIPCEIESTSFEYMDVAEAPATVSFNIKQLDSLDNITILGRALIHNPVTSTILIDSTNAVLTDVDINDGGQILTSQES